MEIRNRLTGRRSHSVSFLKDEKMTKDSFKDETDINNIIAKYRRTGQLPNLVASNPKYGDFSSVPSYQEALETVRVAETVFMALPAAVRAECHNDPSLFLERVKDPAFIQKHSLSLPPSPASVDSTLGQPGASEGGAATQPGESSSSSSGAKASGKSK